MRDEVAPTWIAHLSDLHLDALPEVRERTVQVVDFLRQLTVPPDAVLVTGDITEPRDDISMFDELVWLDSEIRFGPPVLYCPGNSDDREAFRSFLDARGDPYTDIDGQVHQARVVGELQYLLLDSRVPGSFVGRLDRGAIDWARCELDASACTAVVAMHHPPVPLGHPVVDDLRMQDAEELEGLIAEHDSVIATLCGHTHAATSASFAGRPLLIAPGVHSAGQLPPTFSATNRALIDENAAPALALHRVDGRRIVTYFHTLG
jgi:3',5'-cyclic AMP phosphodiesterase CpdA